MNDLFVAQSRRVLDSLAVEMGCEPAQLVSETLEVVARQVPAGPGKVALAATSGLGTVVSVPAPLAGWVRAHAPATHFRAMQPFFLAELAAEVGRSGVAPGATAHGFSQGFALSELLAQPGVPDGHSLAVVDRDWMARYRPAKVFDNALGEPEETDRIAKTTQAFAVLDSTGEPAAVAGWWADEGGRIEVGVDVRRHSRGLGLARVVVIAATRAIIDSGGVPFYSCGATNIRSHRTALSCGFLPVFVIGSVWGSPGPTG